MTPKWGEQLAGFDVFIYTHCQAMEQSLRVDQRSSGLLADRDVVARSVPEASNNVAIAAGRGSPSFHSSLQHLLTRVATDQRAGSGARTKLAPP